ncbi:MAG: FAD-binding protein, partial [Bdellovibrio sp.]
PPPLEKLSAPSREKVLIIGSGPAGLFAALRLTERGIPVHIFEQGSPCHERLLKINKFWRSGQLDPYNNVCFGEGGAGLYSDGKLITRIKSPYIPYVLGRLVEFGAPEEILYLANPHVGSDRIRRLIPHIRKRIEAQGGHFHFNSPVTKILIGPHNQVQGLQVQNHKTFYSPFVILACGHSAEPLFQHLRQIGVFIEGKSFAVGLRIEHPRTHIDTIQYGSYASQLETANYKLSYHDHKTNIGVYSFCMCPGGYVLSSGTEPDGVVCNGMSNYNRNAPYSNAALVVTVDRQRFSFPFEGLLWRKYLEKSGFLAVQRAGGHKELPAQTLTDFLSQKLSQTDLKGSSPSGLKSAPLHDLLPPDIYRGLCRGIENFSHKMRGFEQKAILYGMETRTSCPIRITRHKDSLQSVSHPGLYPCGEGAGYAGGITSAACDGIKVAEAIFKQLCSQSTYKDSSATSTT